MVVDVRGGLDSVTWCRAWVCFAAEKGSGPVG